MNKRVLNLKISEELYEKTDQIAKEEHMTKTQIVENGIRMFIRENERKRLAVEMKKASLLARNLSLESAKEWETALSDGHKND